VTIWGLGVIVWYGFVGWRALALMRQAIPFSTRDAAGVTMVAVVADAAPIDRPSGQLLEGIVEALVPWRQLSLTDAEGARLGRSGVEAELPRQDCFVRQLIRQGRRLGRRKTGRSRIKLRLKITIKKRADAAGMAAPR